MVTWKEQLGAMRALATYLGDSEVAAADADEAVRTAQQVERQLFRWRRSVEAAYLDRYANVPGLLAAASLQEEVPPLVLVAELLREGALVPSWWRLDAWAAQHGLRVWPEDGPQEDEQEGADTDG